MPVWFRKMVLVAMAGKGCNNIVHLQKKNVINITSGNPGLQGTDGFKCATFQMVVRLLQTWNTI